VVSRPGRDPAGWLLALAVCLLPPERSDWGRAMNAELSHIDRPLSRWRFAAGCLRATMWQRRLWRVALVVAVQAAAVALALMSPIGGALRAEVIVLAVLAPPALRVRRGGGGLRRLALQLPGWHQSRRLLPRLGRRDSVGVHRHGSGGDVGAVHGDPMAFSVNGATLATDDRGVVVLWNVTERAHPIRLAALAAAGWGTFSPHERTFATSSTNAPSSTTLWDIVAKTRPVRLVTLPGGNGVVFSPNGHLLATRTDNGSVILWSLADPHHPERIATLTCGTDPQPMAAVSFSPDGRTLATVMGNDAATIWDVAESARPVRTAVLTRRTRGAGQVGFSTGLTTIGGTASDGADAVGLWRIRQSHRNRPAPIDH
jgi:hypothetical protein